MAFSNRVATLHGKYNIFTTPFEDIPAVTITATVLLKYHVDLEMVFAMLPVSVVASWPDIKICNRNKPVNESEPDGVCLSLQWGSNYRGAPISGGFGNIPIVNMKMGNKYSNVHISNHSLLIKGAKSLQEVADIHRVFVKQLQGIAELLQWLHGHEPSKTPQDSPVARYAIIAYAIQNQVNCYTLFPQTQWYWLQRCLPLLNVKEPLTMLNRMLSYPCTIQPEWYHDPVIRTEMYNINCSVPVVLGRMFNLAQFIQTWVDRGSAVTTQPSTIKMALFDEMLHTNIHAYIEYQPESLGYDKGKKKTETTIIIEDNSHIFISGPCASVVREAYYQLQQLLMAYVQHMQTQPVQPSYGGGVVYASYHEVS